MFKNKGEQHTFNYLSDIKIQNRLLKIQFVEHKANTTEYSL